MDTGKTPIPELVTMLTFAHELDISLTEFLFQATRLNLPFYKVRNDVLVDRKEALAALRRFDKSTDPIASFYALFWSEVRRKFWTKDGERPKPKGLTGARAHVRRHLNEIGFARDPGPPQLSAGIFAQVERARRVRNLTNFDLEVIEKLLVMGAVCESGIEKAEAAKVIERDCYKKLRNIQSRARQSISLLDTKCAKDQRVTSLKHFRNKMSGLAELRAKALHEATEKLTGADENGPGPHLSAFYRSRASNAKPERLITVLAEIEQHESGPLPEDWKRLMFSLRSFFYEDRRKVAPRDVLKVQPRLREYSHFRGLRLQLDIFNLSSYFRWALGWTKTHTLKTAGLIALPESGAPRAEQAPREDARVYRKRFESSFSAQSL